MPGVELSSLNRHEMRRLLAAAEARHDHGLAQRLRAELEGRSLTTALPADHVQADARASGRIAGTILAVAVASVAAIVAGWQLGRREPTPPARPPVVAVAPPVPPEPATLSVEVAATPPPAVAKRLAKPEPARAERRLSPQDRRLRRAYERALASGADRLALDRGQARFRQALARSRDPGALYARRIRELEAAARRR